MNPYRIFKAVDKVVAERDRAREISLQLLGMIENNLFGLDKEEWEQIDMIKAELGCTDENKTPTT